MKDFVALDFETANNSRTSVCSIGIVIVKNGKIVEEFYRLIKPIPNTYLYWNTRVHGLTNKDTRNAQIFPQVWAEISPKIAKLPIFAHNSAFDSSCLRAVHEIYKMPYIDYQFHCTCKLSRKKFPFLENHKLNTVSAYCGYDLTNHHHALADAYACAVIALKLF